MQILVTGGHGSVGRDLVPLLSDQGHRVVVLDPEPRSGEAPLGGVRWVRGAVGEREARAEALRGCQAVVHLAWSFADDLATLLDRDLRPHLELLQAAREAGVRQFVYASSAVVYGKPARSPIDEEHPLRVLEARKPGYGVAKEFAEKLTLLFDRSGGPPSTVLRFWWAFGREIGGRHLRDLLRAAAAGAALPVPAGCGGSFLSMEDFGRAVALVLREPASRGQVLNLGSAYVTWEEVARMALEVTGSRGPVEVVPAAAWKGAAFLADRWDLDLGRARRLGFTPARDASGVCAALRDAIAATYRTMTP